LHVVNLCDIVLMRILNAKGVYISWYFFFEMLKDNLGCVNVIILQFRERKIWWFFYFIKFFCAYPSLFHIDGFLLSKGEIRNLLLYIYNKNMIFSCRRVEIGGDVRVTYPKTFVLLNNYLLVDENYYLSHWE